MQVKNIFCCIVLSLFVLSCNSSHIVYQIGDRVVTSKPELGVSSLSPVASLSGECMEGVSGLYCVRDSIAVLYLPNSSHFYRALDLDGSKYVDFLRKGRGPDEIVAGFYSGIRTADNRTLLDISAINEHILLSVDLNETLKTGETVIYERASLPQYAWLSRVIDNRVLSEVIFDEDVYSIKIFDKDSLRTLRSEQVFGSEQYLADYQPLFNSSMRLKPDKTRLSMAMFFFDEVNIFDVEGNDHLSISTSKRSSDEMILKKALRSGTLGNPYYYTQDVTDNYIYGLYFGGENEDDRQSSTIHVFTWDGKLSAVYHMDENLIGIAVSEDDSYLYGLSEDEILYRYNIN